MPDYPLERMFTDTAEEATYWEVELERHNITSHYVTEDFSNDGSLGSFITKVVKDAEASEYIRKLSKLTKRGIQSCAERGYWPFSQAPYGFARAIVDPIAQIVEHTLEPGERRAVKGKRIKLIPGDPRKIDVLRTIFDLYVNHEQGLRAIADYLNRNNVPNPSGNRNWHKSTLRNILRNPAYIGHLIHKDSGLIVEDAHEALIEIEIYKRAQEQLKRAQFAKRGGHTTPYLLTALIQCEQCGNNLHGAIDSTKNRRGYRCSGYTCKGKSVCDSPYYSADAIEQQVITYIQSQIHSPQWDQCVQHALQHAVGEDEKSLIGRLHASQTEYGKNKTRIQNLLEAIADGLPRGTAIQAIQNLEQTQYSLEECIHNIEAKRQEGTQYQQIAEYLLQLPNEWEILFGTATFQEKKRITRMFLARGTINYTAAIITYYFYQFPNIAVDATLSPPNTNEFTINLPKRRKKR